MKKTRWLSVLLAAVCVMFCQNPMVSASERADDEADFHEFQEYVASNTVRNGNTREYDYAKVEVAIEVYNRIEAGVRQSERLQAVYGSAYIGDTDDLVVLLTENTEQNRAEIEALAEGDAVLFDTCAHTYAELCEAQEQIWERAKEAGLVQMDAPVLCASGILVRENCLDVAVAADAPQARSSFWREIQMEYPVRLRYADRTVALSTLRPGAAITVNGFYLSVGYRALSMTSSETRYGFVTAGHDTTLGANVYANGALIGNVVSRNFPENSGQTIYADVAFVATNASVAFSNNISHNGKTYTVASTIMPIVDYPVGTPVHICGKQVAFFENATIQGVGSTTIYRGVQLNGAIQFDNDVVGLDGGDSGGIVFSACNSKVIGSVSALSGLISYASTVQNGLAALQVSVY